MSKLYDSIPPERAEDYLLNAARAYHEATGTQIERAISEVGKSVVEQAVQITKVASGEILGPEDIAFMEASAIAEQRASSGSINLGSPSFAETMAAMEDAKLLPEGNFTGFAKSYLNETPEN